MSVFLYHGRLEPRDFCWRIFCLFEKTSIMKILYKIQSLICSDYWHFLPDWAWLPAIRMSHLILVLWRFMVYLRPLKMYCFSKKNCENHPKCSWNQFFIEIYHKIHIFTSCHIYVLITFNNLQRHIHLAIIECIVSYLQY